MVNIPILPQQNLRLTEFMMSLDIVLNTPLSRNHCYQFWIYHSEVQTVTVLWRKQSALAHRLFHFLNLKKPFWCYWVAGAYPGCYWDKVG